jgi:hypothetical protein
MAASQCVNEIVEKDTAASGAAALRAMRKAKFIMVQESNLYILLFLV